MENKIKALSNERMEAIAKDLQTKIYNGLSKSGEEIACLPTYINPGKDFAGKVLALDWGGTNFRASIILFEKGKKPEVLETLKKTLSEKETKGFTGADLCEAMADLIAQLKNLDKTITKIGYCFSYPAESTLEGDAILLRWTKGIKIPDMINKLVGKTLMDYLNSYEGIKEKTQFKDIKVINDTIACLFAGLEQPGYDSYIGLIVGTGTNMAGVIHKSQIAKLSKNYIGGEFIPVNLESGNLKPFTGKDSEIYLSEIDKKVDLSLPAEEQQAQLFEKAMSGKYVGEIFSYTFDGAAIEPNFDGLSLTNMLSYPRIYKEECIDAARQIYIRSAQLVASSLVGLTLVLIDYKDKNNFDKKIKNICLAADGSLYWSEDKNGMNYNDLVEKYLADYLKDFGLSHINFHVSKLEDANLIGSAIAALS